MKISYAIMAVPKRQEMVDVLKFQLGDIPVVYDLGMGIWDNRVKAMMKYDETADFHCVLQDDAVPCKNFYNEVEKIVNDTSKAYSLYFGNRRAMRELAKQGEKMGGIEMDWVSWGVAIVLPTKIIKDIVRFWETKNNLKNHDDTRIAHYLKIIGMKTYYPIPSLVNHRDDHSFMESNVSAKGRVAYKFKGE